MTDIAERYSTEVETIKRHVDKAERLAQLAEECAELAQAALKLRRAIGTGNPTPMDAETGEYRLKEEIADVLVCVGLLTNPHDDEDIANTIKYKLLRWHDRITQ